MKSQDSQHLQEEKIIWAVIDEMELAADDRQHLMQCQECRAKVEMFTEELHEFGEDAKFSVPPFSRTVKLPGPCRGRFFASR